MSKRLYRSKTDKMLFGVCGGLGEYFEIDPVIVRLLFVAFAFGGLGIIVYIIAAIVISEEQTKQTKEQQNENKKIKELKLDIHSGASQGQMLFGLIILLLGISFLLQNIFHWFQFKLIWPFILIFIGIAILIRQDNKGE